MKFKKGDIGVNEFLGIVFAVAVCVILGIFIYKGYISYVQQEEKAAQNAIDLIETKLKAVPEGEGGKFTVQGIKSKEDKPWYFVQFDKDSAEQADMRPEQCYFSSCVCVCRISYKGFFATLRTDVWNLFGAGETIAKENRKDLKESCESDGFCRKVDGNLYFFTLIKMDPKLFEFVVKKKGDTTCLTCTTCKPFNNCDELV